MPSVNDWAAKAADRIADEMLFGRNRNGRAIERMAAIIATFAEPLMKIVRDSERRHHHCAYNERHCCPRCSCKSWVGDEEVGTDDDEYPPNKPGKPCDCGADAWNKRAAAALNGAKL